MVAGLCACNSTEIPLFVHLESPQCNRHCSRLCSLPLQDAKGSGWALMQAGPSTQWVLNSRGVEFKQIESHRTKWSCGFYRVPHDMGSRFPRCQEVTGVNRVRGPESSPPIETTRPCVSPPDPVSQAPWSPCTALVSMPCL